MFQFPGFASRFAAGYHAFSVMGFPIRTSADHGLFAAPRSLSQLITSFIASESQGIPRTPLRTSFRLFTCVNKPMCSILLFTVSEFLQILSSNMSKNFVISFFPDSFRKAASFLSVSGTDDVEVNGFEPMTPCLQSRCSSQLSYTPFSISIYGLWYLRELGTNRAWPLRTTLWACVDSNHGPLHYQCSALTT